MINISPTTRITLGLVLIMISVFLLGDMLGFIPNRAEAVMQGRIDLAETLAVQYSIAAQNRKTHDIKSSMRTLVQRNEEILSAALREKNGNLLAVAGDHGKFWTATDGRSTPVNISVPILQGVRPWGTVEVSFTPLHTKGIFGYHVNPVVRMGLFFAIAGFLGFLFFIKKTHKNMDPSSIVPSRVTHALNALAEGVLLLDSEGQIMLANTSFAESIGVKPAKLIGKNAAHLKWEFTSTYESEYPWVLAIQSGESQTGKQLRLIGKDGKIRTFMVNSSPVQDAEGNNRGVLATFDDVTTLEEKNDQLENMLGKLKFSRDEIRRQNDVLQILATRDPLTDCLNRRSFFEKYIDAFNDAKDNAQPLTCLMVDIDMFKTINDSYGHATGDSVILAVAKTLQKSMRSTDSVCRYGGEEFCIILPDMGLDIAMKTAERARANIESASIPGEPKIRVTASIGVSTLDSRTGSLSYLVDEADKALYIAKRSGRNCITLWDQETEDMESGTVLAKEPGETASPAPPVSSKGFFSQAREAVLKQEHDTLTGLPNRKIFHDRIMESVKHCRATGRFMAVVMLDLDMFKRVNNALGHKIGDRLLTTVSERLAETLRKSDLIILLNDDTSASVYRLGGDEFGILLTSMETPDFTEQILMRIVEAVTVPLEIDTHEVHLKCSIGVCLFPGGGMSADSLLDNANTALYNAKRKGQNAYQIYDDKTTNASLDSLKLENDLRHAIERNELELHYQPKVELHSGKIIGMEALLRWKHPTIGMVSPVEFIPVAEETGLIVPIGEWVIATACQTIRQWGIAGYNDISIAVNLSAVQFSQKDILEMVRKHVSDAGIDAEMLELEITESTIMDNIETAAATLHELHNEGFHISIDDFGTGYSSLAHLKRFPLNAVKIDRSFVRDLTTDPNDAAIVGAITAMAHSMGLKIIAEGVETTEQLEYLRRLRCDEIQGFLFSRPVPLDEAVALLEQNKNGDAFPDTQILAAS